MGTQLTPWATTVIVSIVIWHETLNFQDTWYVLSSIFRNTAWKWISNTSQASAATYILLWRNMLHNSCGKFLTLYSSNFFSNWLSFDKVRTKKCQVLTFLDYYVCCSCLLPVNGVLNVAQFCLRVVTGRVVSAGRQADSDGKDEDSAERYEIAQVRWRWQLWSHDDSLRGSWLVAQLLCHAN